jgi:NADH dehydrogenase [ubiquinone] 1 alpha subcomplex assembly factor 7
VNGLAHRIARAIEAQGPISVAQFMAMALHDPQSGYYATRDPIGRSGDFITAPEVSQMFGELAGLWIVQCWQDQDKPSPTRLVELGPGRGTLMADALRAIARAAPDFLAAIEIVLVENSPTLRNMQRERLKAAPVSVRWRESFDDALADQPLFLFANEFFDALPAHQYVKTPRGWNERMITVDESGELAFALSPAPALLPVPAARGAADIGAIYEISPSAAAIVERIAAAIARHGGAALIVDYGYGEGAGFGETLQAVADHKFAPVLANPGEADLSAHVDFAALSDTAREAGAVTFGPIGQGALLAALGIRMRAENLARGNPAQAESIAAATERLTGASRMGTLFKALAILPTGASAPPGF